MAALREKPFFSVFSEEQQEPLPVPHEFSWCAWLWADMESAPTGLIVENVVGVDSISTLNVFCFSVTELVEVSLSNIFVNIPATIAIIIEVNAR